MELEALVSVPRSIPEGYRLAGDTLDFRPLMDSLLSMRGDPRFGAEMLHGALIEGLAAWTVRAGSRLKLTQVAFGRGCFMNRVLTDGLAEALRRRGLVPLLPRAVPANDGVSRSARRTLRG